MEGYWMTSITWNLLSRTGGTQLLVDDQRLEVVEGILTRVVWPSDHAEMVLVTSADESVRMALDPRRTRVWHDGTELTLEAVRPGQRAVVRYWLQLGLDLARDIEVLGEPAQDEASDEASWYERLAASDR